MLAKLEVTEVASEMWVPVPVLVPVLVLLGELTAVAPLRNGVAREVDEIELPNWHVHRKY